MPKPKNKYDRQHLQHLQQLQNRIDAIYREATREAAAIGVSIDNFNPDRPFTFEDYPQTRQRVEQLMSQFKAAVEVCVVNGVESEWTLANNKNNELANQVFGKNKSRLTPAQQRRYYSTNESARDAFLQRKERGLSLSDRVWRYTGEFKEEIEMGLDLGLRGGLSADQMTHDLRDYLQHPDTLFRRVRDEHGMLHLSKRAAAFHPGRGVYRSSYMNARRLAATEGNIAYRTSDHTRWQQMDFVVGIEIHLSNNHTCKGRDGKPHPFHDMCDDLAGRYPKDFKFTGWHPHCRCYATSILKTDEEIARDTQKILNGEPLDGESVNKVQDVPDAFKEWVQNNAERIGSARELPYFLRDNEDYMNAALGVETLPQGKVRSQAEINDIQRAWNRRKLNNIMQSVIDGNLPQGVAKRLMTLNRMNNEATDFAEINARLRTYEIAAARHAARTPAQVRIIQDMADEHTYGKAYVNNVHLIEQALGMERGKRMTHEQANQGAVNPNYGKSKGYGINCSTCSGVYVLRRMGFNVEAKPNVYQNQLVVDLSRGMTTWDKWIGGKTTYHSTREWMDKQGLPAMTTAAYKKFLNQYTRKVGIYEFNVGYTGGGGHSTLLERRADGSLVRIEQQVISSSATLDNLLARLTALPPRDVRGVMRVDNARFNPKYAGIARKPKKSK